MWFPLPVFFRGVKILLPCLLCSIPFRENMEADYTSECGLEWYQAASGRLLSLVTEQLAADNLVEFGSLIPYMHMYVPAYKHPHTLYIWYNTHNFSFQVT